MLLSLVLEGVVGNDIINYWNLCIPIFKDLVTKHYQRECVLIIFGLCLEDVDSRSSLCSFLTSLSLTICWNCVEVKSFWFDILLCVYYNIRSFIAIFI